MIHQAGRWYLDRTVADYEVTREPRDDFDVCDCCRRSGAAPLHEGGGFGGASVCGACVPFWRQKRDQSLTRRAVHVACEAAVEHQRQVSTR